MNVCDLHASVSGTFDMIRVSVNMESIFILQQLAIKRGSGYGSY